MLATRIAQALGWSAAEIAEVRRVAILRHLGCTAFAHEAARIACDDHAMLATFADVDRGGRGAVVGRAFAKLAARVSPRTGSAASFDGSYFAAGGDGAARRRRSALIFDGNPPREQRVKRFTRFS